MIEVYLEDDVGQNDRKSKHDEEVDESRHVVNKQANLMFLVILGKDL